MKLNYNDIRYIINETTKRIIAENVYADSSRINHKKKTIGLTYNKRYYNTDNLLKQDYLKTDKMDKNDADAYKIMLKGGIESYNITSIRGTEIMHYFKHLWDNSEDIKVKDNSTQEEYKLEMLNEEQTEFLNQFQRKVSFIVKHCINSFKKENPDLQIYGVSIYPVPSSSKFNEMMSGYLTQMSVNNLPVQVINQNLFQKDLSNLQKDEEFIKLNQDYYDGDLIIGRSDKGSVNQNLDKSIAKYQALSEAWKNIPTINFYVSKILMSIRNMHTHGGGDRAIRTLVNYYKLFFDTVRKTEGVKYHDNIENNTKSVQKSKVLIKKKYTKGPSTDRRTNEIWEIVKPFLEHEICPITNKEYTKEEICEYSEKKFEIKTLSNGERMGLRNYFSTNKNNEIVQQEIEKTKGTVFVIFDDNISGGATLGDICYQCKELGITNIIPITFGTMNQKWQSRGLTFTTPTNKKGEKDFNFS